MFDIRCELRGTIKSQCLTNFSAELTPQSTIPIKWIIYVNKSSNKTSCGAGVILEGQGDLLLEQAFKFEFKATNNQAEYEVILAGLNLTYDMGARKVTCKSDSQSVVDHIKEDFEVKEPLLQRYYHTVSNLISWFNIVTLEHIRREDNVRANAFSQLASAKKKRHHKSIIQICLKSPSVGYLHDPYKKLSRARSRRANNVEDECCSLQDYVFDEAKCVVCFFVFVCI